MSKEYHNRGWDKRRERYGPSGFPNGGSFKGCNWNGVCKRHGINHGPNPMKGKHHSEESRLKASESNKIAQNTPRMLAKKAADARRQWKNPEVRKKIHDGNVEHERDMVDTAERFSKVPGKYISLDRIRPDGLYIDPDKRIYAVETDRTNGRNLKARRKYEGTTFFDGVLWVHYPVEADFEAICLNCRRRFKHEIPSRPRKYCSDECRYQAMDGKVPVGMMVARGYDAERYANKTEPQEG
jgi:hypothetical protein